MLQIIQVYHYLYATNEKEQIYQIKKIEAVEIKRRKSTNSITEL